MNLLGAALYDPTGGAAVSKVTTSLLAMTALDTTNLRVAFTVPAHGMVFVKISTVHHGSTTVAQVLLGALEGSTLRGRMVASGELLQTAIATTRVKLEVEYAVTGLTPGASVNWDAAYGVEIVSSAGGAIKYGGPNDTTTDNAHGAFSFMVFDPRPVPTAAPAAVGGLLTGPTTANTGLADMTRILGTAVSAPATAGILDVNVKNIDNDAASASGTVTFPNATLASTTNITAGTITTVTNLTNAPTAGDLTATMKASVNTEADTALTDYGALKPTTAGRTLDVTATGEAGIDWANIGGPTTAVNLSSTTVKTATDVETDTQDIQGRLPAALTAGGNIKADALAFSGDTVAADNAESFFDGTGYAGTNNVIPTVTNLTNAPTAGDLTATMKTSVTTSATAATPTVTVGTNNDKTGYRLSVTGVDDVLDEVVEGTRTFRQMLRGFAAALLAKASGLGTNTAVFRDIDDSKDRITATVDADGNRTAVTLDLT